MSAEANARRAVPEARARELLNLRSTTLPGFRVRDTGTLRKHMTAAEVRAVTLYWQGLPGSASFASALGRLARPPAPAPSYLDRVAAGQAAYYGTTPEHLAHWQDALIDAEHLPGLKDNEGNDA